MMCKKWILTAFCLWLASCASTGNSGIGADCPPVNVPHDKSYLVQKVNYSDEFQIRLTGYENYCYWDETAGRRYEVITPQFAVRRLRDSDETRVDFDFYTETIKGPPAFIGKKSYSAHVMINVGETEKSFSGRSVKVKIPSQPETEFEILLGLDLSAAEYKRNRQGFDIDYRYEGNTTPNEAPVVYVEIEEEAPAPRQNVGTTGGCGCGR